MNIIITGASRGIGAALTRYFAKETGHQIHVLSRSEKALRELKEATPVAPGTSIEIHTVDLGADELEDQVWKTFEEVGSIHVVINNAGVLINEIADTMPADQFRVMLETNVIGPYRLLQALLPQLQSGQAHVVNIGSMGGFQGSAKFPGLAGYSASKAALANLSECLAEEWKEKGIKVNCLALGAVQTEMLEEAFPGFQAPVQPEEMAAFIGDFAANAARMINGQVLPVTLSSP